MKRASVLAGQLSYAPEQVDEMKMSPTAAGRPDDVVIVAAVRTPMAKGKRGAFKEATPDVLLAEAFRGVIARSKINPALIQDIAVGNVLQSGGGAVSSRLAQLTAGIPHTVPLSAVNRQCSSGLQAVANIAASIKAGNIEIGLAAGVESMSLGNQDPPTVNWDAVLSNDDARSCTIPMGITSENVAEKYGVSRAEQDAFAAASQQKAAKAQAAGLFDEEIVPVTVVVADENGNEKEVVVTKDEGIRANTTAEGLGKLKPAFKEGGSTTAGNSSQVSDGAAAVLLMTRRAAEKLGLTPLALFKSYAVAGVPPEVMGIGPKFAIPLACQKAGIKVEDVDIFEINEAFASQAVYCAKELRIPAEKLNPKGGAIALGHPLGMTGARQIATLLPELKRTNKKYGVVSMCIGTGMGAAAVIERL